MSNLKEPQPAFRAPAQSCDAHFHVFGPADKYPHGGVNEKLRYSYTIAHMGMFLAKDGPNQRGFQKMLDVLRSGDGRMWVKFTGTYRMATLPTMADAAPMARALIEAAPNRLIWGSDYPHLSFADKVGSVQLFNLLADWAPDDATRR